MQVDILKLYGEIWQWNDNSAERFIARLNELDGKRLDVINLHIHCSGGEVLEGIAIYNAIVRCKTPVDAYIDGVAASMATIVMLACRRILMAKNAFLMIHAPSGGAYGTASALSKAVKVLHAMERNFKRDYAAKTGKTEAEVSRWLDGGENWFAADEALSEKLIDGISDAVDAGTEVDKETVKSYTPAMMYQQFSALNTTQKQQPKNNSKTMNKEELIKRYGLTSVTGESSEDAIYAAIEAKLTAADEAKKNAEAKLKTEMETQITAMVNNAVASKKITEAQKAEYAAIGASAGVSALQMVLTAIKDTPTIHSMLNNTGGTGTESTEPKTFTELQKQGDTVLAAWKRDRPQDYARLYKNEFGHDITV